MTKESERREYFRINDKLPLEYRSVAEGERGIIEDRIKYGTTQTMDKADEMYFFREKPVKMEEDESEQLYSYLRHIERKLDFVIDLLYKSQQTQHYVTQYAEVSLSGAGIKFVSDAVLDETQTVELKIVLPIFPYPKITALCSVVRGVTFDADGRHCQEVGLRFDCINEADRDLLINYIFMKEREHLRMLKEMDR